MCGIAVEHASVMVTDLVWGWQMQALGTSDYRGFSWPTTQEDEDDSYPL